MISGFGYELTERYDNPDVARTVHFDPCVNYEVAVTVSGGDGGEPMFFDALDLLRAVSHVALDLVYGPSPTDGGPRP